MNGPNRREYLKAGIATTLGLGAPRNLGACSPEADQAAQAVGEKVSPRDLAELSGELSKSTGHLILPGDNGYAAASAPANGRFNSIRPFAVARCQSEADVVICVKWSVKHGVSPVVRGGGHSYAGFSTTQDLLIDIGKLNQVTIDETKGIATVGGAATNGVLFEHLVDGPFIIPGGTCLGVGIGGLVLGGGIGYNTRWAGLTCDRLKSTRIVIASGEVLEADAMTHDDLYWACRGGAGGSFGINTSFVFDLVKVPEGDATYYRFDWRGAEAAKAVFLAFHKILTNPTPKLNAVAMAQATPVGPKGPREAIDVFSRGHYLGPVDELLALVQPLLDAAKPRKQCVELTKFWDIQKIWVDWADRDQPHRETHSFGDISRYAKNPLSEKVTSDLVDLLAAAPARSEEANCSFWSLGWVGGDVVNQFTPTKTAYVHRNMLTLLRPTTVWPNDVPESFVNEVQKWTDGMIRIIEPHTPDESYQNFPNRSLPNPLKAYYGENLHRLKEVKKKYDPKNHFKNPQSIPPE
jgi:FAD/FMN-containing dehydrogenase